MVETSSPVNGDVAFAAIQTSSSLHTTTSADATELEKSVEHRAIVADIVFTLLFRERVHIVWRDLLKKVDVLICVELGHFMTGGRFCALEPRSQHILVKLRGESLSHHNVVKGELPTRDKYWALLTYINLHLLVDTVVHDQAMRQPNSMRLHRMPSDIRIISDIRIVEVSDSLLGTWAIRRRRVYGRQGVCHFDWLEVVTSSKKGMRILKLW